jgi:hypothetical protein
VVEAPSIPCSTWRTRCAETNENSRIFIDERKQSQLEKMECCRNSAFRDLEMLSKFVFTRALLQLTRPAAFQNPDILPFVNDKNDPTQ